MKKNSANDYAVALYDIANGLTGHDLAQMLKNFVKLLAKNHQLSKTDSIIKLFEKYAKKQSGVVEIQMTSARKLDPRAITEIKKFFGKKVDTAENIDPSVLGGVIAQTEDKIFDASLKLQLTKLKQSLI